MAEKRAFTRKITESDAFLDMPLSTQCLYFHLNMNADDDGFVNSPKKVMRTIGANDGDMKILIEKKFVYWFDVKGLVVIKHWWLHNVLKNDRYKETEYQEEKAMLSLKENRVYKLNPTMEPNWFQDGSELEAERIPNIKEYKVIENKEIKHKYGSYKNVLLSDKELDKLKSEFSDWEERIERCSEYCASKGKTYSNYLATIRNWARNEKPKNEESVPSYDSSKNKEMSEEEKEELLKLMGKDNNE